MQNLEPQKLIEASALFRNLKPHETEAIIARLLPTSYKRGARILERGIWHGQLYIIASGQVSVLLHDEGVEGQLADKSAVGVLNLAPTENYIVARLGPGECFGEMSLITGEPPSATIRAEEDTTLWSLPQADFLTLIGDCPTLLQNINSILSQRLVRTNRQILGGRTGERIWLHLADRSNTPEARSLALHIADALAVRSRKRVLLLELCGQDEAVGPHVATFPDQVRPSLFDCIEDASRFQLHRTPTFSAGGEYYPALAALAGTSEQLLALEGSNESSSNGEFTRNGEFVRSGGGQPRHYISIALPELSRLYDYLLLVTTQSTPPSLMQATIEYCQRSVILVAADVGSQFRAPLASYASAHPFDAQTNGLFVAHVPEQPTIGIQDYYAARLGYPVKRLLPADTPLLEQCLRHHVSLRQVAPEAALTKAVDFVARSIGHQTVGIAFGGGGARGFAHLGVLERLLHYNIPLDYIAACSSGIIAPGMYLIGKSFPESEKIFLEIQRHIVQWTLSRISIFSNRGMKHMLRSLCGDMRFEDLTTPFAMVAVDLATRSGVVLDRGPIWLAGLACVALPGIFPPVLVGEHILMDAGMHDPVPIRLVRQMGADILLASELGGQEPPSLQNATPWLEEATQFFASAGRQRSPHIVDLLLRTYDMAMATLGMHSIREADVVIRPKLHRISLRQFSEGRKFVVAGREAVEQSLPALKEHLPWL